MTARDQEPEAAPGGTAERREPEDAALGCQEFAFIFSAIPSPVVVYDAAGRPVQANPAAIASYGLDPTTVDRLEVAEWFGVRRVDGRPVQGNDLPTSRALRGELVRDEPYVFTNARGEERAIIASVSPLWDGPRVAGAVAVWHDVTSQRRLLEVERARTHEARLRTVALEHIATSVAFVAPDFTVLEANSAYCRRLERPREWVLGRNHFELFPNAELQRLSESVRERGEPVTLTEFVARPEPEQVYWNASIVPVKDETGAVYGLVLSALDVTEQVRAREQAAAAARERVREAQLLETILDNVPSGVAYLDREFRHVRVNPMYESLVHLSREELIGRRIVELQHVPQVEAFYERVRDTGEPFRNEEFPLEIPEQPERGVTYWNGAVAPLKDETGYVYGMVLSLIEVTGQVHTREQMLAAERARTQLAQQLGRETSHRVKNTLATVAGLLQIQADQRALGETGRALLRDAITRVRTFAVLHEQVYQRQAEDVELVDALRRIVEIDRAALGGAEVAASVAGEPVSYAFGPATDLCVAANELITSAMRHGAPDSAGRLRVEVQVARRQGELTISVWDSGTPTPGGVPRAETEDSSLVRGIVEHYYGTFTIRPDRGGTLAEVAVEERRLQHE